MLAGPAPVVFGAAIVLAAWQVQVDRSVFDRYFGPMNPIWVVAVAAVVGIAALASLEGTSDFAVLGPGSSVDAALTTALVVPILASVAIGADVVLRYPEDMNVAVPDALRFYPAMAVAVEIALHLLPIAVIVAVFGTQTGLAAGFWRLAIPVALGEAALQAAYAQSTAQSVFSAVHLLVFGVVGIWMFWRFGFLWMLGFRLAYYLLWHVVWGIARLKLLFG